MIHILKQIQKLFPTMHVTEAMIKDMRKAHSISDKYGILFPDNQVFSCIPEVKMLTACTNCEKVYPSKALGNELKIVDDQVLCPVCRGEGLPVAEGIGSVYRGN